MQGAFRFQTLGISVTNACPLECRHCITMSLPSSRSEMSEANGLRYLRELDGVIEHVSFTGGEPLLKQSRLERLLVEARTLGYLPSVMTSGYWGKDKERARGILGRLVECGLQRLGVSLDRYHLEFLDTTPCLHIAELADEIGLPLRVRVVAGVDDDFPDEVHRLLSHTSARVERNHPIRLGRASDLPFGTFFGSDRPTERCESITAANVVPDGTVYACCGPGPYMARSNPLVLGNANEEPIGEILSRASANGFLRVINARGPSGLLEDLEEIGSGDLVERRTEYTDICRLCMDVCNSRKAVDRLRAAYRDPQRAQDQDALLFLKATRERKEMQAAES